MATITSLKDLIQKLSNDDDHKFSKLSMMLDLYLSGLRDSTKTSTINNDYGVIYGVIQTLYYGDYITEIEKDSLCAELSNIRDCLYEDVILRIMEGTEEGD